MMFSVVQESFDSGLRKRPCTSVERLLLTPNDILGVRILVEIFLQLLPRKGIELLDTSDSSILETIGFTMFVKSRIYLTGAENDTLNFLMRSNISSLMLWVFNDPLEVRLASEVVQGRASERMTEKGFREENDKCYMKR
jgi:hypothetical protein